MKIAVFGAGAWGSALAIAFARDHEVTLWGHDPEHVRRLDEARQNARYLPDVPFPEALRLAPDLATAAQGQDLHLVVTPLSGLRSTIRSLLACAPGTPLIWACKGLEKGSARLPHEIVAEETPAGFPCGVLTGPSFAAEVARGLPTAAVIAAQDIAFAEHWVHALHHPLLRLYASDDLIAAEVGGAVKNVMAIAAGVSDGMGFGLNARAALITRGLAEIGRLAAALGARTESMMGLACMGDLILTCTGDLSRNRRVGLALARGLALPDILRELGQVAEGVSTAAEVAGLAERLGVDMPLSRAVNAMLHEGVTAEAAVEGLLARDPKQE